MYLKLNSRLAGKAGPRLKDQYQSLINQSPFEPHFAKRGTAWQWQITTQRLTGGNGKIPRHPNDGNAGLPPGACQGEYRIHHITP